MLRSLVVPLEDEIKQLKEKLRSAYDEIELVKGPLDNQKQSALVGMIMETKKETLEMPQSSSPASLVAQEQECELCKNYEMKLVQSQETINADKQKLLKAEKMTERMNEDLVKESQLRLELESQWQEKREEHKDEVQKLCDQLNASEQKLVNLRDKFLHFKDDINKELLRVMEERQQIHEHLNTLQKDNDYLSGRYLQNSEYLKDQEINLPQNIEELQESVLKLHENLIVAKVECEFNESKCISFKDESNLLRDQLHLRDRERAMIEQTMNQKLHSLE